MKEAEESPSNRPQDVLGKESVSAAGSSTSASDHASMPFAGESIMKPQSALLQSMRFARRGIRGEARTVQLLAVFRPSDQPPQSYYQGNSKPPSFLSHTGAFFQRRRLLVG